MGACIMVEDVLLFLSFVRVRLLAAGAVLEMGDARAPLKSSLQRGGLASPPLQVLATMASICAYSHPNSPPVSTNTFPLSWKAWRFLHCFEGPECCFQAFVSPYS